ncbi:MAG: response regulator [Burkholderiales bacterium]
MNEPLPEPVQILVVEDDAGDYGLLRATLRQAGLVAIGQTDTNVWAKTLAEAVAAVQCLAAPHVVLLDLSLPDSAGLATVRSMRAAAPELAIVVLTGHDDPALAADALEAGAQDYLVKGQIDRDALRRAVRNAMVRRRLECKVALNEARFHDFGSAASDWWFWEMDAQLRFSWFSPNAQQAIGRSPDAMLGLRRQEIAAQLSPDEKEMWAPHLEDLAHHRPFKQFEYRVALPGGAYQWLSISGVPIFDEAGGFCGFRGTGTNASERKAQQFALEQANRAAQAANVAKSRFLATMSHEIRTPMNGVLGMAQLMMTPHLQEAERLEYARTILNSGQTLLTLLNDILDLSKVEAGKLELESRAFDPSQILHETRLLFTETAAHKGLALIELWSGPAQHYLGDAHRLRQMVSNLVGNAIKFSSRGEIRIEAREVTCNGDTAQVEFSVTDSGIGIAQDKQEQLFQPFSQADNSTTREFGGTGLGLSIVRSLARVMDGDAGVESTFGQGSRFWFRIGVHRVAEGTDKRQAQRGQSVEVPADPTQSNLSGRVLVAEDNRINQMVIRALLAKLGLTCEVAGDGQQVVDALLACADADRPDLILMDLQMPVLDGYGATAKIRAWEAERGLPRMPIIALTADAFAEDRVRCISAGMDDFLSKPVDRETLAATLRRWLTDRA